MKNNCEWKTRFLREKKPSKRLENFPGYSISKKHYPKTVEDSFREVYYDGYDFVIAAIKKRFDQPNKCMLLCRMFYKCIAMAKIFSKI